MRNGEFDDRQADYALDNASDKKPTDMKVWSLVAFSFFTALSVAFTISALMKGVFPDKFQSAAIISLAGLLSLFHLGRKNMAWSAVSNLKYSSLSREIALFILYSALIVSNFFFLLPFILILSSLTGLALLISVDAAYVFADKRKSVYLHSGQVFITALLMVSFLMGRVLPFIFIAALKLTSSILLIRHSREANLNFTLRFFRSGLLIIAGISMISGISFNQPAVTYLFFGGELIDRILFYLDFKPLNINKNI